MCECVCVDISIIQCLPKYSKVKDLGKQLKLVSWEIGTTLWATNVICLGVCLSVCFVK